MKLADLRKLSIKKQVRIRFLLVNGMECVVNEHGIAQIPALAGVPDFNLEQSLGSVAEFSVESAAPPDKTKAARPQVLTRDQMAAMTAAGVSSAVHQDEHDE